MWKPRSFASLTKRLSSSVGIGEAKSTSAKLVISGCCLDIMHTQLMLTVSIQSKAMRQNTGHDNMTTQLTIAAIGRVTPILKVKVNPCYADLDTWKAAIEDQIDAQPDANCEDAYFMGITDRDLGLPSHAAEYANDHERAAYLAGRCAARRVLSDAQMHLELEEYQDDVEDRLFWAGGSW